MSGRPGPRLRWNSQEIDMVVEESAKILGPDAIWQSKILKDAQTRLEPNRRKKEFSTPLLKTLRALTEKYQQRIRSQQQPLPEISKQPEPEVQAEPALVEPPIPNRLGFDPKFSESLVYVAQSCARTFSDALQAAAREMGKEMGAVVSSSMRDLARDARLGLLLATPSKPAIHHEESGGNGDDEKHDHGNLPEKFRKPKLLILGLVPDPQQAQALMRRLPNADLRFLDRDARAGDVGDMAKKCDATFYGRHTRHAQTAEARKHSKRWHQIDGNASDFARQIGVHFPQALPQNTGEARTAQAAQVAAAVHH